MIKEGAAPGSVSGSEGSCLEPGHAPLSPAGVTARGLPVCLHGPWCPYPSARTQGSLARPVQPLAARAARPRLFRKWEGLPSPSPKTAVGTWPLDMELLVATTTAPFAKPCCLCVGTKLAPPLAPAGDATRNRQERDLLNSLGLLVCFQTTSSQCH